MDERKTIFDYLQQVLVVFAVAMIILMGLTSICGEMARDFSGMFRLGKEGIPIETMLQFLAVAVLNTVLRYILFTDRIIKKVSVTIRMVVMLVLVVFIIAVFAFLFNWFPINMWEAWVSFAICFILSVGSSVIIVAWKTSLENKKMEEALKKLQDKWDKGEHYETKSH